MASKFILSGTDATQDVNAFTGVTITTSNVFASTTAQKVNGTSAIVSTNAASGTSKSAYGKIVGVLADAGRRIQVWIRSDKTVVASDSAILKVTQSSNTAVIAIGFHTDGTVRVAPAGATAVNGAVALSANTWYRLVISYKITDTTHFTVKAFVHDASNVLIDTITATAGTLSGVATNDLYVGIQSTSAGSMATTDAFTVWYDNLYIDDGAGVDDIASDIRCTAKRPFANGTANEFTGTGTPSGYGTGNARYVNQQPYDNTAYVSVSTTTKKTDEYSIEAASAGDENLTGATIVDFMGWAMAKVDSTANSPVHNLILAGAATAITQTTAAKYFSVVAGSSTYPAGNTDVGIDAQYTTTPHTTTLYECGLEVAYIPGVGGGNRRRRVLISMGAQ